MKIKNLFKSLIVVALIVPFAFGLAACGKKTDEKIDASAAYDAVVNYLKNYTPAKKQTVSLDVQIEDVHGKTILGTDQDNKNFFCLVYEANELALHKFSASDSSNKKVYEFSSENNGWQQPIVFVEDNFETYYTEYDSEITGTLEFADSFMPQTDETTQQYKTYAEYSADLNEMVKSEDENGTVSIEGKKYKDGSVGLLITINSKIDNEAGTETCEIVVKDNKLVRLNLYTSGEGGQAFNFTFVYDYLSSQHVPTDLSACVPQA